jgi:hypothetical protein
MVLKLSITFLPDLSACRVWWKIGEVALKATPSGGCGLSVRRLTDHAPRLLGCISSQHTDLFSTALDDCDSRYTPLTPADFTKCLEATNGDMNTCSYYLEALSELQLPQCRTLALVPAPRAR